MKKLQVQGANKTVNEAQIKSELDNLKLKFEFEWNEKEQLRKRYEAELNAAKIRCENEIQKQNQIMQEKYEGFVAEINKLNKDLRELKSERNCLMNLIEKEKTINRELEAKFNSKKS